MSKGGNIVTSNKALSTQHTCFYWNPGKPFISRLENGHSEFPTSSLLGQDDISTHHAEDQLWQSKPSCLHPILPMDIVRANGIWTLDRAGPACDHMPLPSSNKQGQEPFPRPGIGPCGPVLVLTLVSERVPTGCPGCQAHTGTR